jgi:hypothetical protein
LCFFFLDHLGCPGEVQRRDHHVLTCVNGPTTRIRDEKYAGAETRLQEYLYIPD